MPSHLPYVNKLVYHIQTKLGCEIPAGLLADINYALYDYGKEILEVSEIEKDYWRELAIGKGGDKTIS